MWAKRYFLLILAVYLATIAFIKPLGEFATNDDWDFITHVRNFRQLDFVKNSLIDSSFVLQGALGALWTLVFGLSFNALRALTMLVTVIFLWGVKKLLDLYTISTFEKVITLLTILLNPFVLPFSFTFMTELYFLALTSWSVYFICVYQKSVNKKHLFYAVTIACLSLFVRQLGLLLVPAILLMGMLADKKSGTKICIKTYAILSTLFIISSAISFLWPQYNADSETPFQIIFNASKNFQTIISTPLNLYATIPYLGVSLIPFALVAFAKLKTILKPIPIILTALTFFSFYSRDLFYLGNNLYPEGLMLKNYYAQQITLFDNIIFKTFLTCATLFSFYAVTTMLISKWRTLNHLSILAIFFIVPIVAFGDYFDRYLINGIIMVIILSALTINKSQNKLTKALYVAPLTFLAFFSICLSQDFFSTTKEQWAQAKVLQTNQNVGNKVYLSSTYTRYFSVFNKPNGPKISSAMPTGIKYLCYIQKKVVPNKYNPTYDYLEKLSNSTKITKILPNPKIEGNKTLPGYRPPTWDKKKILVETQIPSVIYNAVDSKVFVQTYCEY